MTHRECVHAVLEGRQPDIIPVYRETGMDATVDKEFLPPATGSEYEDAITRAEVYGNSALGPIIDINSEDIESDDVHRVYRYETGAVWEEYYSPAFYRKPLEFPIREPADLDSFVMPDAAEPARCKGMAENIVRWREAGYYVHGRISSAWAGIYYFLARYEDILCWMITEPEAAERLFKLMGKFTLDAARIQLELGVDSIWTFADLGTGTGLLFSLGHFERYFFPWLKNLGDLCHKHGAALQLHSHGHIEDLMDRFIAAGVDMVDPIGPGDNNDLGMFKMNWGDRITLIGGLSKTIGGMTRREMEDHIASVMAAGCPGGRFMPCVESAIPPMSFGQFRFFRDTLTRYRRKHGSG
jgi:hypothetical protein